LKELIEEIKTIRVEIDTLAVSKKEIQEKISALEAKEKEIRSRIMEEMSSNKKRYDSFDSLAEVKIQKTARAYEVVDEQELIKFLKAMGRYEDMVKTAVKISNAPLTKFLDELRSADAIPSCVKLKEAEDSLRITFFDSDKSASSEKNSNFGSKGIRSDMGFQSIPDDGTDFDSL
jgi:carbamoylphosphate synthase small subunit